MTLNGSRDLQRKKAEGDNGRRGHSLDTDRTNLFKTLLQVLLSWKSRSDHGGESNALTFFEFALSSLTTVAVGECRLKGQVEKCC